MHADNVAAHPRANLAGVFDPHDAAAEEVANKHGVTKFASAIEAITGADAVLIATPTATHIDLLALCLDAEKPVLCEKPIDLSLARVNAFRARLIDTDIPIMLGFVRRFDPGHAACQKARHDGTIGALHQVIITSRDPELPANDYIKTSGGIFRDMTIHDLDLARFMLGEEIAEVFAVGSRLVKPNLMEVCDDYDTAIITMKTSSGKQCVINNSREAVYGYDQRVELLGAKGMVISDNYHNHNMRAYAAHETNISAPLQHFFIERYATAFNLEIDYFVDSIETGAPVPVGFEDGRMALLLADACLLSATEGRVVKINELE